MFELLEYVLVIATIVFAGITVKVQNLLYAALSLAAMAATIGFLFALLFAPLAAIFQLLIYTGGTIALFISIIMLVTEEPENCPDAN